MTNLKIPNEPLIFAAGLAVGSVVTWLIVKKKYKDMAQEEINAVKESFSESSLPA